MGLSVKSRLLDKKPLLILICVIGITAVGYGMLKDNDPIFILGIVFVTAGYLLIRRTLKDSTPNDPEPFPPDPRDQPRD